MSEWTQPAEAKLALYLARMRASAAASGADPNEVTEDLRRHIEQEIAARQLSVVTEQDLDQILARLGPAENPEAPKAPSASPRPAALPPRPSITRRLLSWIGRVLLVVLGVITPLIAIAIEYFSGMWASEMFNPIPNIGHLVLLLLVPVANLAVIVASWRTDARWRNWIAWANGAAIGVSAVYTLLFLPITPLAAFAVLFLGIGFIPLAPLTSFICAIVLRRCLRRESRIAEPLPGLWPALAAGIALLVLCSLPSILFNVGLGWAASDVSAESTRGVRLLRTWANQQELLRACYGRGAGANTFYSWGKRISADEARTIFYRVYGKAFNSVAPPMMFAGRQRWDAGEDDYTWDNDQGGDAVAGRVKGLSLASSRQDAVVYSEAALAYVEWTMEFKNVSPLQREARAEIILPPSAVVSRVTLWINDEEREAAFGGRNQVKTAYKEVVAQRRDPVLVTTSGPGRVLMQCFPVPPSGGRMKIRIGMTVPLTLTNVDTGCLRWPCFAERNFTIPDDFHHSMWVESRQPIDSTGPALKNEPGKPGILALGGQLRDNELASPKYTVRAHWPADQTNCWTRDTRGEGNQVVRQTIAPKAATTPERVVFVLDGTRGMRDYYDAILGALAHFPTNIEFAVLLAQDGCEELVAPTRDPKALDPKKLEDRLRGVGGHDNVPALLRAWDLAQERQLGIIVWIHVPQPVLMDTAEELRQRFERSSNPPMFCDVEVQPGSNRILEKLEGVKAVHTIPRLATLGEDLTRLFEFWAGRTPAWVKTRERGPLGTGQGIPPGPETSLHLARLWAYDEVGRLTHNHRNVEAGKLAALYELITPVSGAVVLETQVQYNQAGLQPADPKTVPSVPEPAAGLLLLTGTAVLLLKRRSAIRS